MKLSLVALGLVLVLLCHSNYIFVSPCGMTTHNMVGRRAFNFSSFENYTQYQQYIESNFPVFDAGCAFPDFGYSCGGLAEESEAAHWPPFLRAASKYLIQTYPQPWSADGIKLAVFLLGIASHQVADIPWHSIGGIQEGLIRAMSAQDFNFDYSTAHHNADDGGEFILAYNYNLDWLSDEWYVPVTDIKNIFHIMNYTAIDDYNLVKCNSLLYAGAMAIKTGGKFLYPEIAKKSIFLIDHYQDYFNGGLDDMAVWTSYCWPVLMGWMEGERIGNFCLIQPDPNNQLVRKHFMKYTLDDDEFEYEHSKYESIISDVQGFILKHTIMKSVGSGYSFSLPSSIGEMIKKFISMNYEISNQLPEVSDVLKMKTKNKNSASPAGNYSSIQSENNYSYLGRDLKSVDLNNDGLDDLIVSAPGYGIPGAMQTGCVYYIFTGENSTFNSAFANGQNNQYMNINQLSNGKVCGNETHSKFGWSFDILDFNLDGILDLIIGAPSSGNANLTYTGKVYIYFGQMSEGSWWVADEPSIVIYSTHYHDQVGNLVTSGDCNGDGYPDLILGTYTSNATGYEQGQVTLFYSSKSRIAGKWLDLNKHYSYVFYGKYDYEWFGYNIETYTNSKNQSFILVGSPNYHIDNQTMDTGKLQAFRLNPPSSRPVFTLFGLNQFDKVGYNFQVVNASSFGFHNLSQLLVLSLPTKIISDDLDQAGEILIIDIDSLQGTVIITNVNPVMSFQGTTKYSRFGESILIDSQSPSNNNYPSFYVGAPLWTDSFDDTGPGIVFSFKPQDYVLNNHQHCSISKDNTKFYRLRSSSSSSSILNNVRDSRFGYRMVLLDINNDGQNDLIIGASRDSTNFLEGGSVNIFIQN